MRNIDLVIKRLLDSGRLRVDRDTGQVFAPKSNTPNKAIGARTRKGYLRTCINIDGEQVYVMLHRVVCVAVHGMPSSSDQQVNHISGIKTDNAPANLEWSSQMANMAHAKGAQLLRPMKHGQHYNARLSAEQVADIRRRGDDGESTASLANAFRVSQSHVRRIVTKKRWSEEVQERRNG